MRACWKYVAVFLAMVSAVAAQTRLKLSAIIPGTETAQLVANGDFQSQGPVTSTNTHPRPDGWTRTADIFADPGANLVQANGGVVARALVNAGAPVCQYKRTLSLQANTDYTFSAYMWNLGDSANHVTAVIDLNDAPSEPQVTLNYSDANADQGYFVYKSFNTANTGTNVTVRAFYDSPVGTGASSKYYPVGAQWDNLALTKSSDFVPPATVGTGATNTAPVSSPQPALQIACAGTNFSLYWSTSLSALSLQSAASVLGADWQPVTNSPVVISNQYCVTLPLSGQQAYFRLGQTVDPSTLEHKMLMGYQGWFACPGDGSPLNKWVHWFDSQTPIATNLTVDLWPDISELDPDELFATSMTLPDGSPAKVYSPWKQKTVLRHFKWMKDYDIDGVFLQRFTSELANSSNLAWRNGVAANVRLGAETYGRVFAIMYDVSGQNEATLVSTLTNDWVYLVNTLKLTESPRYIRHQGKPVVAIWGFGFTSRSNTPDEAQTAIDFFKAAGCTVLGGVPTYWRTLSNDSQTNAAWADVYRSFDILSPWLVTRFSTTNAADSFKTSTLIPDLNDCNTHGMGYMPVVWPGFSWHNLYPTYAVNQIPRYGGAFYWRQVYNAIGAGCTMLYGAMFDELNEGTSMFKMAPTTAQLPTQATLVPLNMDGANLPSDWYLRLAGQATKMLRGQIPVQPQIPISP